MNKVLFICVKIADQPSLEITLESLILLWCTPIFSLIVHSKSSTIRTIMMPTFQAIQV